MYYGLIMLSVVMFGANFALSDVYRRIRGSSFLISIESTFIGALAGLIVLLAIEGFTWELTPFTLVMAMLATASSILFNYCSFKALEQINLSAFSLFSMLGGMVLPFVLGLALGESLTLAKIISLVFICAALALTVTRGEKKKGYAYYVGIFLLNGASGVLAKLFTDLPFDKTSAAGYSVWCAITTVAVSGVIWAAMQAKQRQALPRRALVAYGISAVNGAINRVANLLLVMALLHVDASVQYPMVTGGVMIVSTLICLFTDRKPTVKEIISVGLAFVGMLALFIIPI